MLSLHDDMVDSRHNPSKDGKPHIEGSKEYLMTLAGELVVSVAGEDHTVRAGGVLAFPGDQRHSYRNPSSKRAEALSVVLPMPYVEEIRGEDA